MSEERAVPFYCPFCGNEDLRPYVDDAGTSRGWHCRSCARIFTLSLVGLVTS